MGIFTKALPDNRSKTLGNKSFGHIDSADGDGATGLLGELLVGWLDVVDRHLDVLADKLLSQELSGLEHEGDIIQRPEGSCLRPVGAILGEPKGSKTHYLDDEHVYTNSSVSAFYTTA